jgi:hypothetical protein
MGKGLDVLRAVSNSPHTAVLHAEFRRGLKDLQDLTVAFPDSMKSRDEANTIANPTSYIATQERLGRDITPEKQDKEGVKAPEMELDR